MLLLPVLEILPVLRFERCHVPLNPVVVMTQHLFECSEYYLRYSAMELLAQLHHVEEMTMGKKYEHKSLKIQGLFRMKADQLVNDQ